jgi:hypothetical protein
MFVDEIRDHRRRQHRLAVDQHDMQPDAQAGHEARALHRIRGGRRGDHQAGARKHTIPMGRLDRIVHRNVQAEIVGADDDSPQLASCRSRRKWKNSTPSRSRRFIIVGLRTISLTIETILPVRK